MIYEMSRDPCVLALLFYFCQLRSYWMMTRIILSCFQETIETYAYLIIFWLGFEIFLWNFVKCFLCCKFVKCYTWWHCLNSWEVCYYSVIFLPSYKANDTTLESACPCLNLCHFLCVWIETWVRNRLWGSHFDKRINAGSVFIVLLIFVSVFPVIRKKNRLTCIRSARLLSLYNF